MGVWLPAAAACAVRVFGSGRKSLSGIWLFLRLFADGSPRTVCRSAGAVFFSGDHAADTLTLQLQSVVPVGAVQYRFMHRCPYIHLTRLLTLHPSPVLLFLPSVVNFSNNTHSLLVCVVVQIPKNLICVILARVCVYYLSALLIFRVLLIKNVTFNPNIQHVRLVSTTAQICFISLRVKSQSKGGNEICGTDKQQPTSRQILQFLGVLAKHYGKLASVIEQKAGALLEHHFACKR